MKLLKFEDKNRLERRVFTYKERRAKVRWEYGWENGKKMPPEYHQRVELLNRRIRNWETEIKRLGKKRDDVPVILKSIYDFMGVDVKLMARSKIENNVVAKGIYYKYGVEKCGMHPCHLAEYIGMGLRTGSTARMNFNLSFIKHPERKNMYDRFLLYLEDIEADGI